MIAKCKAIAYGKVALEYIFREAKLKNRLLFQELCSDTPRGIYEETVSYTHLTLPTTPYV